MDSLYIKNERENSTCDVKLIKMDSDDSEIRLGGAIFDLMKLCEYTCIYIQVIANLCTNKNGEIIVRNLPKGKYKFVEKKAPRGYKISGKSEWTFKVDSNLKNDNRQIGIIEIEAYNHKAKACLYPDDYNFICYKKC